MSTRVLREYAAAIRGDWFGIDGRAILSDLVTIADAIEREVIGESIDLEKLRRRVGLCAEGGAHWMDDLCGRCKGGDGRE